METKAFFLTGSNGKQVQLIAPVDTVFPTQFIDQFKSYCGAGEGIGDLIVPEKLWGLCVSPACFIHDQMWDKAEASWGDFHFSNSVFLRNILAIVESESGNWFTRFLRMHRAVTYYNAVDSVGKHIFWKLKAPGHPAAIGRES